MHFKPTFAYFDRRDEDCCGVALNDVLGIWDARVRHLGRHVIKSSNPSAILLYLKAVGSENATNF